MKTSEVETLINKVFEKIFNAKCPFSIDEVFEKFAFDLRLPQKVKDSTTGETTWADATSEAGYISQENMEKYDNEIGWMREKRDLNSLDEVIKAWREIDLVTTERSMNSTNVSESDTIYSCENIFHSTNCYGCKNLVFCDDCNKSESLVACQRSTTSNFSLRIDDSSNCTNSYNVIYSNKIASSFFIRDCANLTDCLFCSHITNKHHCIANMQFSESEYEEIKQAVVNWIFTS